MSNIVGISHEEWRYHEASQWIARLDRTLSDEERQELIEWMKDPRNEALLLEMATLWDRLGVLSHLAASMPRPANRQSMLLRAVGVATAAIALIVAVALLVSGTWSWDPGTVDPGAPHAYDTATYETALGEQSSATLVDGTRMTLNTSSHVEVSYGPAERLVRLNRGEVHLEVAHDETRPLRVLAGDRVIQAVGTSFAVNVSRPTRIEVIVTDGAVVVDSRGRSGAITQTPVVVSAGQAYTAAAGEAVVTRVSREELTAKLSWRNGSLIFRGESLEEALNEVSRYTPVQFLFLDQELRQERISGRFRVGDIETLMTTLELNFGIAHRRIDDRKVLLSRAASAPSNGTASP